MRHAILTAILLGLAGAMTFLGGSDALAKSKRADFQFGGKWDITLFTPVGDIPATVSLQPNGKGKIWLGNVHLPAVLQYDGNWISWATELPAVQAPDGNAHTIIGRGSVQEDGTLAGNLVIVTNVVDEQSPVGYETHVGTFGATRKGAK